MWRKAKLNKKLAQLSELEFFYTAITVAED